MENQFLSLSLSSLLEFDDTNWGEKINPGKAGRFGLAGANRGGRTCPINPETTVGVFDVNHVLTALFDQHSVVFTFQQDKTAGSCHS